MKQLLQSLLNKLTNRMLWCLVIPTGVLLIILFILSLAWAIEHFETFKSKIFAEWMVAIGTISLALITFITHMIGDSSTRLMKKGMNFKFDKEAYDFLKITFCAAKKDEKITTSTTSTTIEENINNFYEAIFSQKLYLTNKNVKKYKKYVFIAKQLLEAFKDLKNHLEGIRQYRLTILNELKNISTLIGKEEDFQQFKEKYDPSLE